jgi:protein tyrosine phosphatase (PTP) superfamily phosphohydrolase (DUF442 family)
MNFVEFKTHLLNNSHVNMGIDTKKIPVRFKIDLHQVESFREELDENENPEGVVVYTQSGESYWIDEKYDIFSQRF